MDAGDSLRQIVALYWGMPGSGELRISERQLAHMRYRLGNERATMLLRDAFFAMLLSHEGRLGAIEDQMRYTRAMLQVVARAHELQRFDPVADITSPLYERERHLDRLDQELARLAADFEDVELRLQRVISLKEALREFWRFARESRQRYVADIAGLLYDALRSAYAEEMTGSELDGIRQCLNLLRSRAEVELQDAQRADAILRRHGLESVPV